MQTKQVNFRALTAECETFSEMLMVLCEQAQLSRGRAIMRAAEIRPVLYRKWMLDRNSGRLPEKRGRGSIMSHFKFIGG